MALEVAANGGGVALGRGPLVDGHIRAGRLAVPFGPEMPTDEAFYLVAPADRVEHAEAAKFRSWLTAELTAEPAAAAGQAPAMRAPKD